MTLRKFWALEVAPGNVYSQVPPYDLILKQVALDSEAQEKVRTVLLCKVGDSTFTLGSVRLGESEQFRLDIVFDKGTPVDFFVQGPNSVHLTGNYQLTETSQEITTQVPVQNTARPVIKEEPGQTPVSKKRKPQDVEEDDESESLLNNSREEELKKKKIQTGAQRVELKTPNKKSTPTKNEGSPVQSSEIAPPQTPKTPASQKKPVATPKSAKSMTKLLPNGLQMEDVMIGVGKEAAPGRRVTVHYVGTFPSGKKFDSGRNFTFRLGQGQVIKGWDIGVKGMRVGGRRTLVVPPSLGYGPRGAPPDIPGNSTLCFDVELVDTS